MSAKEKNYTLDDAYLDFNSNNETNFQQNCKDIQDIMSKSVFTDDWERRSNLPQNLMARKSSIKIKAEPKKLPEEIAQNVQIVKMRSVIDPKRFYKKDKSISATRNIQIGRVIDSAVDFYHSRLPKKQRKSNMVDELLADAQFKQYNKRRFRQIIETKKSLPRNLKRYKSKLAREKKNKKGKR